MIVGLAIDGERRMLILGLSRKNVERLVAGAPIYLSRSRHGDAVPEGWSVAILFGETEMDLAAAMQAEGKIGPGTKVHVDLARRRWTWRLPCRQIVPKA